MPLRLLSISVYGADGDRRDVKFNAHGLSILTGESKTGKSAVIHIVDYCLGSKSCHVPEGIIRQKVAWFLVLLTDGESHVTIARRNPSQGYSTSSDIHVQIEGSEARLPQYEDLRQNIDLDGLRSVLCKLVGLTENLFVPPEDNTRRPLEANFSHAKIYCFQDQSIIDNKNQLFFNAQDGFVAQAIKDTLPYFVGAVSDTELVDRFELNRLRRQLRIAEKRLEARASWQDASLLRANALLAEAREVGLVPFDARPASAEDVFNMLLQAAQADVRDAMSESDGSELEELFVRKEALRVRYFELSELINEALSLESNGGRYSAELSEQQARLSAVKLLHSAGDDRVECPLCSSHVTPEQGGIRSLTAELEEVSSRIHSLHDRSPRLQSYIKELRAQRDDVEQEVHSNQAQINSIVSQSAILKSMREERVRRSRVQGRISSFLELVESSAEDDENEDILLLRHSVARLESGLSGDAYEDRLRNAESNISEFMTEYARMLDLEHASGRTRLDFKRLTVVSDTEHAPIRLENMGSGDNWVGCHVIAHAALHRWFRNRSRPVPAFLILDQPSKAHYPPDESQVDEVEDDDRRAVIRLFRFLYERALEDGFQIIVVDHADEADDWFQESIVERWRGGQKLVPDHWPDIYP